MPKVTVNPAAEASASFDVARPGAYRLRIEGTTNFPAVQEFTSKAGSSCLKVRFVYSDPTSVCKEDGSPANLLGGIIDNSLVVSPAEKQGKLRGFVEACGLAWEDFDTDDLTGKEVMAKVEVEEYQGTKKNVIKRYIK